MIIILNSKYLTLERVLTRIMGRALRYLKKPESYLEAYLVTDRFIRDLNKRFKKSDKVTNVLAFPFKDFPQYPQKHYLGEVYLAPDYVKKTGNSLEHLVIHGLLHLLGYTHEKKRDRIRMEKLEKKLMQLISRANKAS